MENAWEETFCVIEESISSFWPGAGVRNWIPRNAPPGIPNSRSPLNVRDFAAIHKPSIRLTHKRKDSLGAIHCRKAKRLGL